MQFVSKTRWIKKDKENRETEYDFAIHASLSRDSLQGASQRIHVRRPLISENYLTPEVEEILKGRIEISNHIVVKIELTVKYGST